MKEKHKKKKLPRIAYGISDGVAYIYGIQGYRRRKTKFRNEKKSK